MSARGAVVVVWGVGGIIAFVLLALVRIIPIGFSAYQHSFTTAQWALLWTWVPAMMWAEGYRGFHQSFSPMVAARAKYLAGNPKPLHLLLAPLFCLGFIHATPARRRATTVLTVGIAVLVFLVRMLEQPWRGIIDLGVVMGLSIGLASMGVWTVRAFTQDGFDWSPDVPEGGQGGVEVGALDVQYRDAPVRPPRHRRHEHR
ncbi:MAG: hypothetical protein OEU54_09475 [Gemmatimonadota bacterium]|nr:hypothetical protein [Gemmatimonadota bacterium]